MADAGIGRLRQMTNAGEILRDQITRDGPVPFHRFMEVALYQPGCGFYQRGRDPFGRAGDYFTAEQIQPVFGILVAQRIRQLYEELGRPADFIVVELGAGRAEMAEAFSDFRYSPVEIGAGGWPARFTGVVFSNEFFDALPVHVVVRRRREFREMLVDWRLDRFVWSEGAPVGGEVADYLSRYAAGVEDGSWVEVNLDALGWLDRIAARLERGWVVSIDYGYTAPELIRFPRGTLMSYRRHVATEDVLLTPGDRDITAHVNFTALAEHGARRGLRPCRLENLSRTLIAAGEPDAFALALNSSSPAEDLRRRAQLKTLLFGMGETFRTLIQRKAE
ncbi:MAG: class I SAM-dependent methyltransferase [Bryobacteraceae bacterium]